MKSKTPRTDEHLRMKEKNGHVAIVSRDFARQLETELAEKDRQLAEAWAEIERFKSVEQAQIDMLMSITGGSIVCANGSRHTIIINTCLYCELADKEKQLAEAWAEIERLKRIGRN